MPDLSLLDGVDDISWAGLRHAYGAAGDVPSLLRAVAFEPGEAGRGVRHAVWQHLPSGIGVFGHPVRRSVSGQNRRGRHLPRHGARAAGLYRGSDDECGLAVPGAARAAVARQIDVLAPLLANPDAEVRAITVWALTQARAPVRLVPLLRQRWDAETQPTVKATVLKALSVLDPQTGWPSRAVS